MVSLGGGGGGISALIDLICWMRRTDSGALLPLVTDIDDVVETDDTDRRKRRERAKEKDAEEREVSVDELGVVGGDDGPVES